MTLVSQYSGFACPRGPDQELHCVPIVNGKRCQPCPEPGTVPNMRRVRSRSPERRPYWRGFVVRDAHDNDLPNVTALLREVFDESWRDAAGSGPTLDGVRLHACTGTLLVAEDSWSTDVLGSVALMTVRSPFAELASVLRAEISALVVRSSERRAWRGKGPGPRVPPTIGHDGARGDRAVHPGGDARGSVALRADRVPTSP